MPGLHIYISKSAKKGFLRLFAPRSMRIEPLKDIEAWKQDGIAIRNDWGVVGNDIRVASERYGHSVKGQRA